ncbi:MAG: hypothetical protein FJY91_00975 [Candidatus Harrisonbacteria bacterium]|nr:hypothetical protein [Candidatus Harrisonbacteria bacterium]
MPRKYVIGGLAIVSFLISSFSLTSLRFTKSSALKGKAPISQNKRIFLLDEEIIRETMKGAIPLTCWKCKQARLCLDFEREEGEIIFFEETQSQTVMRRIKITESCLLYENKGRKITIQENAGLQFPSLHSSVSLEENGERWTGALSHLSPEIRQEMEDMYALIVAILFELPADIKTQIYQACMKRIVAKKI